MQSVPDRNVQPFDASASSGVRGVLACVLQGCFMATDVLLGTISVLLLSPVLALYSWLLRRGWVSCVALR